MKINFVIALILLTASCKSTPSRKQVFLDSLKKELAGKDVHISFFNSYGAKAHGSLYAYTDENKKEIAFEVYELKDYQIAPEEDEIKVETLQEIQNPNAESDMIMIEEKDNLKRKGFLDYLEKPM